MGDGSVNMVAVVLDISVIKNMGRKYRAARTEALEICPRGEKERRQVRAF